MIEAATKQLEKIIRCIRTHDLKMFHLYFILFVIGCCPMQMQCCPIEPKDAACHAAIAYTTSMLTNGHAYTNVMHGSIINLCEAAALLELVSNASKA